MMLKEREGWNQTTHDWRFMIDTPENYCLAAEFDGRIIGTAVAVNYGETLSWISMVLVNREYRGLGTGKNLLSRLMGELRGRAKLDATPEGRKVYEKLGFYGEYEIIRMMNPSIEINISGDAEIIADHPGAGDSDEIIRFDKKVFGADRSVLIKTLLRDFPEYAWVTRRNNRITGFVLGRNGSRYIQAGPLYALSQGEAGVLLEKALSVLNGRPVIVDIPEHNSEMLKQLAKAGFLRQRSFLRMFFRKNTVPGEIDHQYLICGPEYG
jgi:hypothetical protein